MFNDQSDSEPTNPRPRFGLTAEVCGIAPLNAFVFVIANLMLFGGELATGWLLGFFSVFVGMMLLVPFTLIQRYEYNDRWTVAISKAFVLATLTGIPVPVPSMVIIAWAAGSAIAKRHRVSDPSQVIDTDGETRGVDDQRIN